MVVGFRKYTERMEAVSGKCSVYMYQLDSSHALSKIKAFLPYTGSALVCMCFPGFPFPT